MIFYETVNDDLLNLVLFGFGFHANYPGATSGLQSELEKESEKHKKEMTNSLING